MESQLAQRLSHSFSSLSSPPWASCVALAACASTLCGRWIPIRNCNADSTSRTKLIGLRILVDLKTLRTPSNKTQWLDCHRVIRRWCMSVLVKISMILWLNWLKLKSKSNASMRLICWKGNLPGRKQDFWESYKNKKRNKWQWPTKWSVANSNTTRNMRKEICSIIMKWMIWLILYNRGNLSLPWQTHLKLALILIKLKMMLKLLTICFWMMMN